MSNVVAIVQARMGSTRFPNKVMEKVGDTPLIGLLLSRLARAEEIDQIVLATSDTPENLPLINYVAGLDYEVFLGDEADVLDRYYQAALRYNATHIVRITGDCPLVDPGLVDKVIQLFFSGNYDYAANTFPPSFPDGMDVSVCSLGALKATWENAVEKPDREHIMSYIRRSERFNKANLSSDEDLSGLRLTVDEPQDLQVIKVICDTFSPDINFSYTDIVELYRQKPVLFSDNANLKRNEGEKLGTGQKLWKRAKHIIPGGNMLLSKRSEMFLPEQWPSYFSKAKGCSVWDMDGNQYTDMSIMGIGTNVLGYGREEVDKAVQQVVVNGNMSTFNCPEEVYLAEKLIDLHPWADMARLARTGGEANAIAVRIGRAASGKDKVAFCGYHGWHDWYLAANLDGDQKLSTHLLPGLEPKGVPAELEGTVLPFQYNRFDELENLVRQHDDIGVIKMEVKRNEEPKDGFLEKVRNLATQKGIVLIFDECTSGFRETNGGLHKKYGVTPDIAVFGKALGNGYAITAVIGKRNVMDVAQSTFISSTFWTERIGPSAALATLDVMEKVKSWEKITRSGGYLSSKWKALAEKHDIPLRVFGIPALIKFAIESPFAAEYKTLITQEMLGKGYLAGNSVYVCTEHTDEVIDTYIDELDEVFALISECERGKDVKSLLKGPVCHAGFKRLN